MYRLKVTVPDERVAGSRLKEKSAVQLSRSVPALVAARVFCSTCTISSCIHSPVDAFASSTARSADPTVRSSSWVAEDCTLAAMFWTSELKVCNDRRMSNRWVRVTGSA